MTLELFLRTAEAEGFAILAYSLMPDHTHWLVEGLSEAADLRRFVKFAKQRSGAAFTLRTGARLWQEGFHERVLRNAESSRDVARYVVANAVRAGIVESPMDYPFCGSGVWTIEDLLEGVTEY